MQDFRFVFEVGSKKYPCPKCRKLKLKRYVDTVTGELMPDMYGRCDSGDYHRVITHDEPYKSMAREYQYGNTLTGSLRPVTVKPASNLPAFGVYPNDVLKETMRDYPYNFLLCYLAGMQGKFAFPFPWDVVLKCASIYKLGTMRDGLHKNGTTFPYIDIHGQVRTIQIRCYDEQIHSLKGNYGNGFLHKSIEYNYKNAGLLLPQWLNLYLRIGKFITCLFGEHLLAKYPNNPVYVVEAPKTAIIAALYYGLPDEGEHVPIWLAPGSLDMLKVERCRSLEGRNVQLFPDLSPDGGFYSKWGSAANQLRDSIPGISITLNRYLEKVATPEQRERKLDIADVLLLPNDWREVRLSKR